jgi:hypothetical protein
MVRGIFLRRTFESNKLGNNTPYRPETTSGTLQCTAAKRKERKQERNKEGTEERQKHKGK